MLCIDQASEFLLQDLFLLGWRYLLSFFSC